MKLAIVTDVHADVHALQDALVQIERLGCDEIVCAGDVLDYGVFPEETIRVLRERRIPTIRGNHKRWAVGEGRDASGWDLTAAAIAWIEKLPPSWGRTIEGIRVAVWHARPGSDMKGIYPDELDDEIPFGRSDLVGTLVHEFGHFTGLAHTPNTVMNATDMGGILHRYPYGDDIDCSGVKWGFTNRSRYVANMPPQPPAGGFSAPVKIAGGSDGHFSSNGAIGADSAGQKWFVSGSLGPSWNTVQFTRAHHPVNLANPGWLTSTMTEYSRRPPSVASRPPADSVHLWGAAWTPNQQTLARDGNGNVIGNGIQIIGSTDEFQTTSSAWWLGPNTWNIPQEPTLFYDINTQRFGILFVRSDNYYQGEGFAVTSPDLVNWNTPQDLGFTTLDAPYASCVPFSWCTMTWTMSYLADPKAATKSFTISPSTGAIQWGSSQSSSFSDVPRGVGITASRVAGNPTTQNWLAVITLPDPHYSGSLSVPSYEIYWSQDPGDPPGLALNPFPSHTGWPYLVSNNRANIVSDPWDVDWTYVITTGG